MTKLKYESRSAEEQNRRDISVTTENGAVRVVKPMEDFAVADDKNGIYMAFDGVTRPHAEYLADGSMAYDVTKIFCESVYSTVKAFLSSEKNPSVEALKAALTDAAERANALIARYNEEKNASKLLYKPGTLGTVAVVLGDTMVFGCIGDGWGVLLRDGTRMVFSYPQTARYVAVLGSMTFSCREDMKRYQYGQVNKKEQPNAYGVLNGEHGAMDFFNVSSVKLSAGDTVILASDGLAQFLRCERTNKLTEMSVEEMLETSRPYDVPPFNEYADDKCVVKIEVK